MNEQLERRLLGAVADVIHEEAEARELSVRELTASIERQRERIDEYGNVIRTRFAELAVDLRQQVHALAETMRGPPGERGERGEVGEPGARGGDGAPGQNGQDGAPGARGERGEPGERGAPGEPGPPGPQGEAGQPGAKGEAGQAGLRGEPGERGLPGERGVPGLSPQPWRHRRTYDPAGIYQAGDVVAHDGGSSVAIVDDPGALPGDGWAQLTQRGKTGKPGDRGPRGEAGPVGEKGERGSDGVGIDDLFIERGMLVVLFTDGRHKELQLNTLEAA